MIGRDRLWRMLSISNSIAMLIYRTSEWWMGVLGPRLAWLLDVKTWKLFRKWCAPWMTNQQRNAVPMKWSLAWFLDKRIKFARWVLNPIINQLELGVPPLDCDTSLSNPIFGGTTSTIFHASDQTIKPQHLYYIRDCINRKMASWVTNTSYDAQKINIGTTRSQRVPAQHAWPMKVR